MSTQKCLILGLVLFAGPLGFAQPGTQPAPGSSTGSGAGNGLGSNQGGAATTASVSSLVQPTLLNVQQVVGSLNTGRWKAPNEVKAATDRNLTSIQRDLVETLPGLIGQADSAAGSVPPAFAVYRNIDALYDVLLRVSQTAMLAAPDSDATAISDALDRLESTRRQLGDAITASAQTREVQIVQLRAAVKAAAAAAPPPPPPKPAVIDDGPAAPAAKKKRKPAPKPAAKPATPSPSSTPSPQTPQ